jgi:hypothetical protein
LGSRWPGISPATLRFKPKMALTISPATHMT